MVSSNDYFVFEVCEFVQVLEEPEEVTLYPVIGEVTSMDEDIPFHGNYFIEVMVATVSIGHHNNIKFSPFLFIFYLLLHICFHGNVWLAIWCLE